MLGFYRDDNDALREAYRRYFLRLRNLLVLAGVLLIVSYFAGIPHLQTNYTYVGTRPANGFPRAAQKTSAWYIGPSRDGIHFVQAGQYGQEGCPVILFIPFEDCFSLPWRNDSDQ